MDTIEKTNPRSDPDFIRLEKRLAELSTEMDKAFVELTEKFPPRKNTVWCLSAANTLWQNQVYYDINEED
jgi:hypothetical protein